MAINTGTLLKPFTKKITRIEQMWTQPCGINPFIWILGYFAASPAIAYAFLQPDCLDDASERVRIGHHRRRKGSLRIADYAKPLSPPDNKAGWIGFRTYELSQRIGWWITLIDGVEDWVIYGTSFAYQWSGCADPKDGYASVGFDNALVTLLPAHTFTIKVWRRIDAYIFTAGPTGIATPSGFSPRPAFNLSQNMNTHPPLPDADWTAQLLDSGGRPIGPLHFPITNPSGTRSVTWATAEPQDITKRHEFQVQITKSFGILNMNGTLVVSGMNAEGFDASACGRHIPLSDH